MALLPYVSCWLGMLAVLWVAYALEARRPRSEARGDASLPVQAPSVRMALLLSVVMGPLIAPIWFWFARRSVVGLAIGFGAMLVASSVGAGIYAGTRALMLRVVVAQAHAACTGAGPTPKTPDEIEQDGPCRALYQAYASGRGCVDGAKLVECSRPIARPFATTRSPERAKELAEQRCFSRKDLAMCEHLRAGDRARVEAQMRAICCTWWQTGSCEAFGSFRDCR